MIQITHETSLTETESQRLYAGLLAGDPPAHPRRYAPLTLALRDADSSLVGGLLGATVFSWLAIDVLWIEPAHRGQGFGRRLVEEAEAEARRRGCAHARLDTFEFQARDFYERLGYRVYGELLDFPPGHVQFHLRKRLAPVS